MNDNGWDVHFMSMEGAWMEHRESGHIASFERVGNRFELVMEVVGGADSINSGHAVQL